MAYFSENEIREYCRNDIFDQGKQLHEQRRVGNLSLIGDNFVGTVKANKVYRVVINRKDEHLHFYCGCEYNQAGACEHAVAVMFAANLHAAIQVGINWDVPADQDDVSEFVPTALSVGKGYEPEYPEVSECDSTIVFEDIPPEKPRMRLYLSEHDGMLLVEVRFVYHSGIVEFSRSDTASYRMIVSPVDGRTLRVNRSKVRESVLSASLDAFDLIRYQTGYYTPSIDPRVWTLQHLPQLAKEGYEIYGQERLLTTQARKTTPRLNVTIRSQVLAQQTTFDCSIAVSFDGIPATLAALVTSVRQKNRFILLTDGSSGILPQRWLDTFAALFAGFDENTTSNMITLNSSHIGLAEALFDMADDQRCDDTFQIKKEQLHQFSGVCSQPLPEGFKASLRHYQQAGFEWFYFLKEFRFGGCLADDMGLGKTVQTLALLLKEKELGTECPSLIIVPNSLLFNWQREAKTIAPSLNMLTYHGTGRNNHLSLIDMADVVLTTYGTVIRDAGMLSELQFHYLILDEAQAIKNPEAQISKVIRSLHGHYHLALSGTPIENNLSELWSLFAFLNPGLLGTYRMFCRHYIRPIERDMSETTMNLLRKLVFPFILRRTKAQVVKELPPKNEMVVYTEMVPPQRIMYDSVRRLYYGKIVQSIGASGVDGCGLQLLEGLLRLRQICSHPLMYDPSYTDDSGKFQLVDEMLQDAVTEGHRVLVFSQFVATLELLRKRFSLLGICSELLTGATANRQKVVDRFQEEKGAPVFLISLKAGGTGLNLTAADYVFHIDPWWNPSAENQASDRAYRIGQTKSVFVYKMITRESIEERVLELQERKRQIMSSIIREETSFFKSLSREDVLSLFE